MDPLPDFAAVRSARSLEMRDNSASKNSLTDRGNTHWVRKYAKKVIRNKAFHLLLGLFSLANGLLIGIATDCSAKESGAGAACGDGVAWAMFFSEIIFGVTYCFEFMMHVLVHKCLYFKTSWGIFDVVFVSITIASLVLLRPPPEANGMLDLGPSAVSTLTALRIFRVFRITRSISFMVDFTTLWLMVTALFSAASAIAYALLLGIFIVFTFSVVGVTNFSYLGQQWGSIGSAMLTLLQIATYDDWTATVSPVLSNHPVSGWLFVGSYLAIVPFTLLPLVTAVLTNHSLQTVQQDSDRRHSEHEKRLATVKDELEQILSAADANKDGDISKEELRDLWNSTKHSLKKARTCLKEMGTLEELEEIFDFLSLNDPRQASISREEFLKSMLRYKSDKQGFLMAIALQHLGAIRRRVLRLECKFESTRREQRDIAIVNNPHLVSVLEPRQKADNQAKRRADKQRAKTLKQRYNVKIDVRTLRDLFESVDHSKEGLLDKSEFSELFHDLHGRKPGLEFAKAWRKADSDGSGWIDFDEFLEVMCEMEWYKNLGMTRRQDSTLFVDEASVRAQMEQEEEQKSRHLVGAISSEISESLLEQVETRWAAHTGEAVTSAASQAADSVANQLAQTSKQLAQDVAERMTLRVAAQVSEAADAATAKAVEKQESSTGLMADRLKEDLRAFSDRLDTLLRKGDDAHDQTRTILSDALKAIQLPGSAPQAPCRHEASTQIDLPVHQPPAGEASPAPESRESKRERQPGGDLRGDTQSRQPLDSEGVAVLDAWVQAQAGHAHPAGTSPPAPGSPCLAAPELWQEALSMAAPWAALAAAQRLSAGRHAMHPTTVAAAAAASGGGSMPGTPLGMPGLVVSPSQSMYMQPGTADFAAGIPGAMAQEAPTQTMQRQMNQIRRELAEMDAQDRAGRR